MNLTTSAWRNLLRDLLDPAGRAITVAPASLGGDWRGRTTREILAYQTTVPMAEPILLCPGRKLGYRFAAAEAAWILSGDNRLAAMLPFARQLAKLSDDGRTMAGAYGPPFVDQLPYVSASLKNDRASRQAVMTLWRPRPAPGSDVPCTVALQWLIRPRPCAPDGTGGPDVDEPRDELRCLATMRSSDAWMGLPYDWVAFSAMSAFLALDLRRHGINLSLGDLTVTAGSQHLYRIDWELAQECLSRDDAVATVAPLDLSDFSKPDDLVEHLWSTARRTGVYHGSWLEELTHAA